MNELRYTFLSDGSSDQALMPILTWLLRRHGVTWPIQPEWADLRRLPRQHKNLTLTDRIRWSLELYPSDLLFVHRDAEAIPYQARQREIETALDSSNLEVNLPVICVIPIRMQEAWLLFDEQAIRFAAGNPNGRHPIELPSLTRVEALPDPKELLYELLREASGLAGKRRRQLRVQRLTRRVTEYIDDFSPLRNLSAFRELERDIITLIQEQGWRSNDHPPVTTN